MGFSEPVERWIRLATVIYRTSTSAVKPVLNDAISTYNGATFEDRLHDALSQKVAVLSSKNNRHLLAYEIEKVFSPPNSAPNTYNNFDIGIVAKLIKYFVGDIEWMRHNANLPDVTNLQNYDWTTSSRYTLVELLKAFRNWVYHHTGDPQLTESEFNKRFEDLLKILSGLGYATDELRCFKTESLDSAKEDITGSLKELIECERQELKKSLAVSNEDVAAFWQTVKCRMDRIEDFLYALKDGMPTDDSLKSVWETFQLYHDEAQRELLRKIEAAFEKLGDMSSVLVELKANVATRSEVGVLGDGVSELLRKSEEIRIVLDKLEIWQAIMPDLMKALQEINFPQQSLEINRAKMDDSASQNKISKAMEECRLENQRLLDVRVKNCFYEDCDRKSIADMMVKLAAAKCAYIDPVRRDLIFRKDYLNLHFEEEEELDLKKLFEKDCFVFVRGEAGAGKTFFCHYILREWIAGRLWKDQYEFVFYINWSILKLLLRQEPFNLESALKVTYPNVFEEMSYQNLKDCKHLIILDTIDECDFSEMFKAGTRSSIENVVVEMILSKDQYHRIVVGQPFAFHQVRERLLTHVNSSSVEVLGFAKEHVEDFVRKYCYDTKANVVWERIRENPFLLRMSHLPGFARIICDVLSENDQALVDVTTRYQLHMFSLAVLSYHMR